MSRDSERRRAVERERLHKSEAEGDVLWTAVDKVIASKKESDKRANHNRNIMSEKKCVADIHFKDRAAARGFFAWVRDKLD